MATKNEIISKNLSSVNHPTDLEKEFLKLQTEYYSDRKWLFRFFFFFLAVVTFVISVLYGLTTNEIGIKIKQEFSSTAMQRTSDSVQQILKRMTFISQSSDSIFKLLSSQSGFYITTGSTSSNGWKEYSKDAIMLEVNTERFQFKTTPIYLTTLYGNSSHFTTTGITSLYNTSPKGFTIYIKATKPFKDMSAEAIQNGWYVQWVALSPQIDTRKQ